MTDELRILDRSRRRWRAIALALALGHVLTLLLVGFLVFWLRANEARMQAEIEVHRALMEDALQEEHASRGQGQAAP
jgi:hypothetical protein